METKQFDLTSKAGFKIAENIFPILGIYSLLNKALSPEKTIERQVDAAIKIIKEGKNNDVHKMKVKVNHNAGIEIKSKLPDFPIDLKIGNDGFTEIEVEYK